MLHPLQCLGSRELSSRVLPGSRARIEGDPRGRRVASRLARDLGLVPLRLRAGLSAEDRVVYHAAATLLSNDLVALLAIGMELFESIGLSRSASMAALLPLARGTLLQAERRGLRGVLTGPVARGDLGTLRAQLRCLADRPGDLDEIHRLLSRRLARAVEEHGLRIPPETLERVRRLAGPRRGPRV